MIEVFLHIPNISETNYEAVGVTHIYIFKYLLKMAAWENPVLK